jgi:hypothetical protein
MKVATATGKGREASGRAWRSVERREAMWVRDTGGVQEHLVDYAKNRRVGPDAESKRGDEPSSFNAIVRYFPLPRYAAQR